MRLPILLVLSLPGFVHAADEMVIFNRDIVPLHFPDRFGELIRQGDIGKAVYEVGMPRIGCICCRSGRMGDICRDSKF